MVPTLDRRASYLALGMLVATACGGPQASGGAKSTVVSLTKIDCAECGDEIVGDIRQRPGVYDASFDRRKAEITVVASPSFDVFTEVRRLAANEGYEALLGGGRGAYVGWSKFPDGADVATVVRDGVDVPDLEPVLVKGKITVIDFSATWCSPCRKIDEHMVGVLAARRDIAYRRLEIGDWDTPLARRWLEGVPSLPYVIVYGSDGQKIESISGLDLARLDAAIARGTPAAAP